MDARGATRGHGLGVEGILGVGISDVPGLDGRSGELLDVVISGPGIGGFFVEVKVRGEGPEIGEGIGRARLGIEDAGFDVELELERDGLSIEGMCGLELSWDSADAIVDGKGIETEDGHHATHV